MSPPRSKQSARKAAATIPTTTPIIQSHWWQEMRGRRTFKVHYTMADVCAVFGRTAAELPTTNLNAFWSVMDAEASNLRARVRRIEMFDAQHRVEQPNSEITEAENTADNEDDIYISDSEPEEGDDADTETAAAVQALIEANKQPATLGGNGLESHQGKKVKQEQSFWNLLETTPLTSTGLSAKSTAVSNNFRTTPALSLTQTTTSTDDAIEFTAMDSMQQLFEEAADELRQSQKRLQADGYAFRTFDMPGFTTELAVDAEKVVSFWRNNGETEFPGNQGAIGDPRYTEVFAKHDKKMRKMMRAKLWQKYCEWRAETAKFEDFFRYWVDLMFHLTNGNAIARGLSLFGDVLRCKMCIAGGNGTVAGHTGADGCWFVREVGEAFAELVNSAKPALAKRFPKEFNQASTVDGRYILAIEWLRLGDGHGLVTKRGN